MKNRLLKGAHLSEKKCKEILQLFCDDLTATQIADISGVSRVTVNNYFRLIRSAIATYCESGSIAAPATINAIRSDVETSETNSKTYYGFYMYKGKIRSSALKNFNREDEVIANYLAVADCSDWQLHWLNEHGYEDKFRLEVSAEIAGFWAHTKGRLQKFRGMNKKTIHLHVKESEFRYNFRNEDILSVLSDIINGKRNTAGLYEKETHWSKAI